ncbi:sensor domain-containing diguanylate cyclase [Bradyrhizobium liaoningense]|uniref:sensor domain-containing diguanylate cyclase n=1 Tax=Bradyrhizobium liaoningense TaxID=43992 RepID=UPI001BA755B9|nr:sensor domain-containing diguanylate cyclase [Bradyrhizobium liaoningense]MBR0707949.1 diguanylate cyclase [Bradyrhizobium liaoningense]
MPNSRRAVENARFPVWAAGFVALACVAILTLSGWREWETRQVEVRNAEVDMANLAQSLTQHAEDTFELADTILAGMVDRMEVGGTSPAAVEKIQRFLQSRKYNRERIRGIFVYDETGRWLGTTEDVDFARLNNSDRDYFQRHRTSADRGTLIGRPVKSRSGGQWIITASRRFNHPDGSFAGVVLTSVDVAYFTQFYRRFDIGPNGSVSLLNADGTMLARTPDENGAYIGRDMSGSPLFRTMDQRPDAGAYYFKSPLDGLERLSFYRKSGRYPILVLASKAQSDVLAPWRHQAITRFGIVTGLTLSMALIGFFLVRYLAKGQRMAATLVAKEADFRLIAEQCSDVVMRVGLDERILYASPSCARILGWDPARLLGTSALDGVNPADRPRVEQVVAALKAGEAEEARIIYRVHHRDKKELWVETALRVTRSSDTHEIDGVVAISRDMTEQKDLQDKLAALATSDGLTGIANRRHFDERLAEEWARAKRDGSPVSLLLVDVDHFKKFNDQYGHQAGDACLRALARILAAQVRRPADLAARYGGEEFALLLPNTDAEGCELLGENVRRAVRDLGMLHALNLPSKIVTVSLGGATNLPSQGALDCPSLVAAADRALYAAKDGGRDRLVMSGQVVAWPGARSA